jgi:uncharacterized protein (DUF433 family)
MISSILGSLAAGFSRDDVLANYPGVHAEYIDATLAFAADLASYQTLSACLVCAENDEGPAT